MASGIAKLNPVFVEVFPSAIVVRRTIARSVSEKLWPGNKPWARLNYATNVAACHEKHPEQP
jgi:hypothetical protein